MDTTQITTRTGAKYDATRNLDIAQVAKLVRADIKAAKASGALGDLPAGLRITVRIDRYSMGQSIDIRVAGAPQEWAMDSDYRNGRRGLTEQCWTLGQELAEILAAYNYDRSDSMSDYYDVRFSPGVLLVLPSGGHRSMV